jgi:hypothetical protein
VICVTHVIIVIVNDMADCCLTNLGCLQIPSSVVTETGQPGGQGAPGTPATITLGSVTTGAPGTPVDITNSGTTSAAIFDFEIPEGAPGTNGTNASSLLFSIEGVNSTLSGWRTLLGSTPSLPANTFVNTGDRVIFEAGINHYYDYTGGQNPTAVVADIRLLLNGSTITLSVSPAVLENKLVANKYETSMARFVVSVRKAGATRAQVGVTFIDSYGNSVGYNPVDVTIDFTSSITVGLQGSVKVIYGTSYVSCEDFSATLYSA